MRYECDFCGLSDFDLPDGIDPDFIFETVHSGEMACQGCAMTAESVYDWDDEEEDEDNG